MIRLTDIVVKFGEKRVLDGRSLAIEKGDFIVLSGPNGGGKTTLLRVIAGLLSPTSGRVERPKGLRTGYLPQYRRIDRRFPITVREVVLSGLQNSKPWWQPFRLSHKERVAALLDDFLLTDLAHRPIDTLSGGQWQRTLLARAVVARPDLLLLDEPETHLDAENKTLFYTKLAEWRTQTTVVIVSHSPLHYPGQRDIHLP